MNRSSPGQKEKGQPQPWRASGAVKEYFGCGKLKKPFHMLFPPVP